jgi:hypothetical protein
LFIPEQTEVLPSIIPPNAGKSVVTVVPTDVADVHPPLVTVTV